MFSRIQCFRMINRTINSISIIQKRCVGGEIKEANAIYYDNTFGDRPYHKNVIVRTGYSKTLSISENKNDNETNNETSGEINEIRLSKQNQETKYNNYKINKYVLRFKGEKLEINPHYNSIF